MKNTILTLILVLPLMGCMHPISPTEIKKNHSQFINLESKERPEKIEEKISDLMMKCLGNVPVPLEFRPTINGGKTIIARGGAGPYLEYLVEINQTANNGSNLQAYINSYTIYDQDYKEIIINASKGLNECPQ